MIDDRTLLNLLAWGLQVALIVSAASLLPRLLRVADPSVRHVFWRVLLAVCLALPLCQPWQAPSAAAPAHAASSAGGPPSTGQAADAPGVVPAPASAQVLSGRTASAALFAMLALVALARLAWLAGGILRLARLRRHGTGVPVPADSPELIGLDTSRAEILYLPAIRQPVTFGVRRPVICLPGSLREKPLELRRVVIAHELWHVRRRDWLWLVLEEAIRSALWFHPAIAWVVARIHRTREEVVDELTVLQTNARRTYLEALLAFADEPAPIPSASFARRRHLFHRMQQLTTEVVMSSKRVVVFCASVTAVVAVVTIVAAERFPLRGVAAPPVVAPPPVPALNAAQAPSAPASAREAALKSAIAANAGTPSPYLELASLQEARQALADAEATFTAARAAVPNNTAVLRAATSFYMRQGDFQRAMQAVEETAALDPSDPSRHMLTATLYCEKAQMDQRLSAADKLAYIEAGIAATNRALALDANAYQALVYKGILLRMQAQMESDPVLRQRLVVEADALRTRAMSLNADSRMTPPPPPPPPQPPRRSGGSSNPGARK